MGGCLYQKKLAGYRLAKHDAPRGANYLSLLTAIVGKSTKVWPRDQDAIQIQGIEVTATKTNDMSTALEVYQGNYVSLEYSLASISISFLHYVS